MNTLDPSAFQSAIDARFGFIGYEADPQPNACRKRKADRVSPCSVTMPRIMREALIRRARQEDRSFSATIRQAITAYLNRP